MVKKVKNLFMGLAVLTTFVTAIYIWRQEAGRPSAADLNLISIKPLESKMSHSSDGERVVRSDEPDAVSEKVAQSLMSQLKTKGKHGRELAKDGRDLAEDLAACSAIHASKMQGDKSSCFDEYSGEADSACLIKRGFGRKSVGQVLTADRFDLNGDGIRDYIITDRYYCHFMSANQSQVFFVMLSHKKEGFHLAFADWIFDRFVVVEEPKSGSKVLIERHEKAYGIFNTIMQLEGGKYVPRVCIVEDEHGVNLCERR